MGQLFDGSWVTEWLWHWWCSTFAKCQY